MELLLLRVACAPVKAVGVAGAAGAAAASVEARPAGGRAGARGLGRGLRVIAAPWAAWGRQEAERGGWPTCEPGRRCTAVPHPQARRIACLAAERGRVRGAAFERAGEAWIARWRGPV